MVVVGEVGVEAVTEMLLVAEVLVMMAGMVGEDGIDDSGNSTCRGPVVG